MSEHKPTPCCLLPNCVSSVSQDRLHRVAPLIFTCQRDEALDGLIQVISSMRGARVRERTPDYLYAEFKSRLFGFIDDVEFFLLESEKIIHVKSSSRTGVTDFGVNRRRIERIRKSFNLLEVVKGNGKNR